MTDLPAATEGSPERLKYGSSCVDCELAVEVDVRLDALLEGRRKPRVKNELDDVKELNHVATEICDGSVCRLAGYMAVESFVQVRAARRLSREARDKASSAASNAATAAANTYVHPW